MSHQSLITDQSLKCSVISYVFLLKKIHRKAQSVVIFREKR